MKEILEEPKGNTYKQLLDLAFSICDECILVDRDQHELTKDVENFLNELKPYIKEIKKQDEWPGTTLIGHYANVYYFDCTQDLKEILLRKTEHLYEWLDPKLLEDLCFFKNSNEWLVTIAHEGLGFIMTEDQIEIEKVRGIEGIVLS